MAIKDQWELWFPEAYEVNAEAVRSFARGVRSPHVEYQTSKILPADTPIPSTLLAAPMFQGCSTIVSTHIKNVNLSQVMQTGQAFTYYRPLRFGDVVSFGARLTSHVIKAETDLMTIQVMAYVDGAEAVGATISLAHSQRDMGVDLAAVDAFADQVMMTGTGPSQSDAYADALRVS